MLLIEMMVVVARRGCVVLSEGWFIEEGGGYWVMGCRIERGDVLLR